MVITIFGNVILKKDPINKFLLMGSSFYNAVNRSGRFVGIAVAPCF